MIQDTGQLVRTYTDKSCKTNKASKTRKNSQVQTQELIKNSQEQINNYIQAISQKINKQIQQRQGQFLLAYQRHLMKVNRQLQVLKKKSEDQQKNLTADKVITHLTKQTALFRQQAMRLSNQLEDTLQDISFYKRKAKQPQIQLKKLQQRLKQMVNANKRLTVQLQLTKKENKEKSEQIDKLKQQIAKKTDSQNISKQKVDMAKQTPAKKMMMINSPKYQYTHLKTQPETNFGNRTSASSLSRRLFSNKKLKMHDFMQAQSTARYSQHKKSKANSNIGYHSKAQQEKNWQRQNFNLNNSRKNPSQTNNNHNSNLLLNNLYQQEQFLDKLRRHIQSLEIKLRLKQKNLVKGSIQHKIYDIISNQESIETFLSLFNCNSKNEITVPIALVSSDLMTKMQHYLNFESVDKFASKLDQKQKKKQKYFKNKKNRILTGRYQNYERNLQFI